MKELKILLIVFILILILGASFIFLAPYFKINISFNPKGGALPKIESSLSSDRTLYQNNEKISLSAKLKTDKPAENITVHIYGIENDKGRFMIDQSRNLNLTSTKDNPINFTSRLPNCFSCAGIGQGSYKIKLEVIKNNKVISSNTLEISLVSTIND